VAKLFYDDEFDALAQTIANSEREFKQVAAFLFPHLKPPSGYARLKACLNPDKDERLTLGQIVAMCRFCDRFDALYFMCDELHHARPNLAKPGDEIAQLQRDFIESVRDQKAIAERIERLTRAPLEAVR
jgi:hypothetical protein